MHWANKIYERIVYTINEKNIKIKIDFNRNKRIKIITKTCVYCQMKQKEIKNLKG